MKTRSHILGVLLISVSVSLFGCKRDSGEKTFQYLQSEQRVRERAQAQLKQISIPVFPDPPPTNLSFSKTLDATSEYLRQQRAFFDEFTQLLTKVEEICNQTEMEMGNIDAAGVDPDAIRVVHIYEQTLGDSTRLIIDMKEVVQAANNQLHRNLANEITPNLAVGLLQACVQNWGGAAKSTVDGVAGIIDRTLAGFANIETGKELLQKDAAALERDKAELLSACSQTKTSFTAKYPESNWNGIIHVSVEGAWFLK